MKQQLPWVIAAGAVAVALGVVVVSGRSQPASPPPVAATQQTPRPANAAATAPSEGRVVHTFEDEAKLREFGSLWQGRQSSIVRMTVLQAYWNGEQASLAKLNEQLGQQYQVDPAKDYTLDGERRVLIEQKPPEEGDHEQPKGKPKDKEEAVIHTFADQEAVQAFATLWRERQAMVLRMRVLQAYWENEQAALTDLNSRLAADYHLDTTKSYFLDSQRHVLIEREVPPATASEAEAPQTPAPSETPAPADQPATP